jgi:hypothetical protein
MVPLGVAAAAALCLPAEGADRRASSGSAFAMRSAVQYSAASWASRPAAGPADGDETADGETVAEGLRVGVADRPSFVAVGVAELVAAGGRGAGELDAGDACGDGEAAHAAPVPSTVVHRTAKAVRCL